MIELAPGSSKRKNDNAMEGGAVWCRGCLDDECIKTCAFCGCRKCYGKHDSANILVCDGCEEEWHIYCLSPPLSSVPKSSEWHCEKCVAYRERTPRPRGRPPGPGSASRAKADEKTKQVRSYVVAEPTVLDPN